MSTQTDVARTSPVVPPGSWVVDPAHSTVEFAVKHMGIATVRGRFKEFATLRVPTALPFFFTGLRVAVSFAVLAAIFGEWVGATTGLGIYMELEKNALRTDLVFGAVLVTALISMILYSLTFLIQRLVMPWYHRSRQVGRSKR